MISYLPIDNKLNDIRIYPLTTSQMKTYPPIDNKLNENISTH